MLNSPHQISAKSPAVIREPRLFLTSGLGESNHALILTVAYFWLFLSIPIVADWPPPLTFALLLIFPMTLPRSHTQLPRGVISLAILWWAGIGIADFSNGNFGSLESWQALLRP